MNEILRIGKRGDSVKTLQLLLIQKGYRIGADGIFGGGTEDAVEDFQEKNNLSVDGIVGKGTWHALMRVDEAIATDKKINDTKYVLTTQGYEPEPFVKKSIVLHHTNGWVYKYGKPSMSHFNWWTSHWGKNNGKAKVATAYSIDYAGNIFQHFDPAMWAYHLGLGARRNYLDKQSIGIELTNEGYMTKNDDGKFNWYSGTIALKYNRPNDEPVFIKDGWRDYNWYAPYSQAQIDSSVWLTKYLMNKFDIENNVITDFNYHPELFDGSYKGIYGHANVRKYPSSHNKWDISPAFPIKKFKDLIS